MSSLSRAQSWPLLNANAQQGDNRQPSGAPTTQVSQLTVEKKVEVKEMWVVKIGEIVYSKLKL